MSLESNFTIKNLNYDFALDINDINLSGNLNVYGDVSSNATKDIKEIKDIVSEILSGKCIQSRQSPINIPLHNLTLQRITADNSNILYVDYAGKEITDILNIGPSEFETHDHHFLVQNSSEHFVIFNGHRYNLLQFHFHKNSEHALHGKRHEMEVHFVHKSATNDELLVIGLLIDSSGEFIGPLDEAIRDIDLSVSKTLTTNMPADIYNNSFYVYSGSLTTHPFTSNAIWIVFDNPIYEAKQAIDSWPMGTVGPSRALQNNFFEHEILHFE